MVQMMALFFTNEGLIIKWNRMTEPAVDGNRVNGF